jgi:hypothetical protein
MASLPGRSDTLWQADLEFASQEADTIASHLERDRREPDKVLTYVLDLRRLATELERRAEGGGDAVERVARLEAALHLIRMSYFPADADARLEWARQTFQIAKDALDG